MTKLSTSRLVALLFAIPLGLTGCLSKPALAKRSYALEAPSPAARSGQGHGVLALRVCDVSPMFSALSFVYRTGAQSYESDPYASFLVPPDRAIAIPTRAYLRNSGIFADVAEPGSALKADAGLEVHVTELYGDFRTPGQGVAVLALRVLLFEGPNGGSAKAGFQKDYSRRTTISQNTAAAVVAGWNRALSEILGELASDLATAHK